MSHLKIGLCILILSTFLLQQGSLLAQRLPQHSEVYSTRTGLPNNAVLSMAQDNAGLLWIATRNGLCTYDGHNFEKLENPFGIKDVEWENIFWRLFKDQQGNMWVSTQAGRIGTFDSKNGRFTPVVTNSFAEGEFITAFFQCNDKALFLGTNNGNIFSLNLTNHKIKKIATILESIHSIEAGADGGIRVNMKNEISLSHTNLVGICRPQFFVTIEPPGYIHIKKNNSTTEIRENDILCKRNYVLSVSGSRLLIATTRLVKEFDLDGHMLSNLIISGETGDDNEDIANFVFEDKTGLIWVGTNAGLLKIDKTKYRFTNFGTGSAVGGLNSNYVRSVTVDKKKNIWVGFMSGNVNRITKDKVTGRISTTSCPKAGDKTTQAAINVIRQLRSGTILLGGSEGLFYIPKKETTSATPILRSFCSGTPFRDKRIVEVWSICEDRTGKLWVGTRGNGLFVIDPITEKFLHYPYADSNGLATVWQVFEDHRGGIWLCTQSGLDSVHLDKSGFPLSFYNLHNYYTGHPGIHVWSVVEDNRNRLWIGTTDNGLSMVDRSRHTFITYNYQDGLAGNAVCGLLKDDANHLWVSSMSGVTCFDIASHNVRHFTEVDGLPGNDYNFNACHSSEDGELLFGSKNGLATFNPATLRNYAPAAAPVVLRISSKEGGYMPPAPETLTLSHRNNSINVLFAIPEYSKPGEHKYKYMLQGFDDHWLTTDARQPAATYTNIPPGQYTLLVSGTADGQTWHTGVTRMNVVVQHAFWQEPLFIVLCSITGIGFVTGLSYRRFRRMARKEKERNQIDRKFAELELRALQAQMNPHFVFNAINAVQHFMLCNDELSANAYLSRFARLMRLYFESSHRKYMPLCEEIELLKLYVGLEKLRFEDKFDYEFFIAPEIEHSLLEIPSMLLQPFVENAINHGLAHRCTPGRLNIHFLLENNFVVCIIDDNGIGRDNLHKEVNTKKRRHTSSDTIRERLAAYRLADNVEVIVSITDKADQDGNKEGTTVKLEIPKLI